MNQLLFAASLVEIRPALILYTLITFAIVAVVLKWKAWGPILSLAEEREKQITNAIESAKRERAEAEKLLAEQKAAIAEARREAAEMMRKNQTDVEKFRDELMAKSRAEAEALKADAARAINEERQKAVTEIRGMAGDLAVDIAKKILGNELDGAKHKALADQYIAALPKTVDGQTRA